MSLPHTLQTGLRAMRVVQQIGLRVVTGPGQGRRFGPLRPPIRIGSAPGNEVVLEDRTVSRHHVSLETRPDGLHLEDTGSTNGVWLGEHRVFAALVDAGSRFRVGACELELTFEGEPEVSPLETSRRFGGLEGRSTAMQDFLQMLERVAPTKLPVLIEGETGSGKELAARAVHAGGPNPEGPWVVVDCGAAAPSLIESALFGHVKGAFTGADGARPGAFVAAEGGTIFLDEIGELPLELQPKLLRALEGKTVTPLGAHAPVPISARVVAATHRDLRRMVNEGTFREDLYFRLAVCPVRMPPLRERLDDLGPLASRIFAEAMELVSATPAPAAPLDDETLLWLRRHPWTGNVRELKNLLQRAVLMGAPEEVGAGQLAAALRRAAGDDHVAADLRPSLEDAKKRFEREYLLDLLRRHGGDWNAAAAEAQVHVKSLQRLVRRYGLRDELA